MSEKASSEQQRQQVTGTCMLSLAEHHHAKLVTFDARLASMAQGTGRVEVLLAE